MVELFVILYYIIIRYSYYVCVSKVVVVVGSLMMITVRLANMICARYGLWSVALINLKKKQLKWPIPLA
jgi:hypothetical protein